MMKLGKAIVYTNTLEETAKEQIINIQKQPCMRDSKIRIMPDVHSGKDCVIGFTANIKDIGMSNKASVGIELVF